MSLIGTNPLIQHFRHRRKSSFLVNSASTQSSLRSQARRHPYARAEDAEASTKPLAAPSAPRADERITAYFYSVARGQLHPGTSEQRYFWTLHANMHSSPPGYFVSWEMELFPLTKQAGNDEEKGSAEIVPLQVNNWTHPLDSWQ